MASSNAHVETAGYRVVCTEDAGIDRRGLQASSPGTIERGFESLRNEPYMGSLQDDGTTYVMEFENGVSAHYLVHGERGLVIVVELKG